MRGYACPLDHPYYPSLRLGIFCRTTAVVGAVLPYIPQSFPCFSVAADYSRLHAARTMGSAPRVGRLLSPVPGHLSSPTAAVAGLAGAVVGGVRRLFFLWFFAAL